MTERWFVRHRQEWIAETLRVFGFINREHLERKFGISTPQASYDLALYMREQPGAITYNKTAKRYCTTTACTRQVFPFFYLPAAMMSRVFTAA